MAAPAAFYKELIILSFIAPIVCVRFVFSPGLNASLKCDKNVFQRGKCFVRFHYILTSATTSQKQASRFQSRQNDKKITNTVTHS